MTTDDGDPDIRVELTDLATPHCIRVFVHDQAVVTMHTRSAIDLQRKLGLAISDWMAREAKAIIAELANGGPRLRYRHGPNKRRDV